MDDEADTPSSSRPNLSLVPYGGESQEVILRHGSAVVYYDTQSRSVSLRNVNADVELYECPYCHRPLKDAGLEDHSQRQPESPKTFDGDTSFVSPGYFRRLHYSHEGSQESSGAVSPKRLDQSPRPVESSPRHHRKHSLAAAPYSGDYTSPTPPRPASPQSHRIPSNAFSQGYFNRFFVEQGELGRGGKGVVLLVRHVLDNVDLGLFACKRVPVGDNSEWLKKVLIEVQLLQNLSHQNLVSYRHMWLENAQTTTFGPAVPCAFILQQYCNGGDLHNYIFETSQTITNEDIKERARRRSKNQVELPPVVSRPRRMPFEEIFSFFRDITSGLNYLHASHYIHRDLKPSNCLLHRTGSRVRVLVSDFGEMQSATIMRNSTGSTGTISFCAPEVLRYDKILGTYGNFSEASDVFSLGMIVHLMCFGHLPYANADAVAEENEDIDRLRAEIAAWTGMDLDQRDRLDLPERLYKFLNLLLSLNPLERPSTDEILQSIKTGTSFLDQSMGSSGSSSSVGINTGTKSGHTSPILDNFDRPAASTSGTASTAVHSTGMASGLTRRSVGRTGSMSGSGGSPLTGTGERRSPALPAEMAAAAAEKNPVRSLSPVKRSPAFPPPSSSPSTSASLHGANAYEPSSSTAMVRTTSADSMRRPGSSSSTSPRLHGPSPPFRHTTPKLLPAPSSARATFRTDQHADAGLLGSGPGMSGWVALVKVALLCIKLHLVFAQCQPASPRLGTVYLLLGLAAVDLLARGRGSWHTPVPFSAYLPWRRSSSGSDSGSGAIRRTGVSSGITRTLRTPQRQYAGLQTGLMFSLALLALHVLAVYAAKQWDLLCDTNTRAVHELLLAHHELD